MLYWIIKPFIRLALAIFCKKTITKNKELLQSGGPLLLVANHPNALMDAIIVGALFKQPVHFLTRGDVFNSSWKRRLLGRLNMVPIYRIRDGIKNLQLNQFAFNKSHAVLKSNGIVLIFIEGACLHTHELMPFKKGAARIAFNCWHEGIPVQVLPISVRYNSLFCFGKHVLVNMDKPLIQEELSIGIDEAKNYLHFNEVIFQKLYHQLKELPKENYRNNYLIFLPAIIGKIIHAPLYYPVKAFVKKRTRGNEFYDSVLFGLLFVLYPIYLLLIVLINLFLTHSVPISLLVCCFVLFTAWCAVHNKN